MNKLLIEQSFSVYCRDKYGKSLCKLIDTIRTEDRTFINLYVLLKSYLEGKMASKSHTFSRFRKNSINIAHCKQN